MEFGNCDISEIAIARFQEEDVIWKLISIIFMFGADRITEEEARKRVNNIMESEKMTQEVINDFREKSKKFSEFFDKCK